jgi:hypothetical protein
MNIRKIASSRLNYDWIGLATALIGFLMAADLSFLPPRYAGVALLALGAANVTLAWYRAQLGMSGQKSLEP